MVGSVHVGFTFSTGLAGPVTVPLGLLASCTEHVRRVEELLGLELEEPYRDNPSHWKPRREDRCEHDEVLCIVAQNHNGWVRWLYDQLAAWSVAGWEKVPLPYGLRLWVGTWPKVLQLVGGYVRVEKDHGYRGGEVPLNPDRTPQTEVLAPEQAATIWHALQPIVVPVGRWTMEYYRNRMERMYEVLRGQEVEGVNFGEEPLTPEQAGAVVWLLDVLEITPGHGLDLAVPKGHDRLASSYDGGYAWCTTCGAVDPDELCEHMQWCDECGTYTGPGGDMEKWCEHYPDGVEREDEEVGQP